jgi:hypothetical protein
VIDEEEAQPLLTRLIPAAQVEKPAILLLDSSGRAALNATGNGSLLVHGCGPVVIDSNTAAAAVATGKGSVLHTRRWHGE